jgi:hypothetical protein
VPPSGGAHLGAIIAAPHGIGQNQVRMNRGGEPFQRQAVAHRQRHFAHDIRGPFDQGMDAHDAPAPAPIDERRRAKASPLISVRASPR